MNMSRMLNYNPLCPMGANLQMANESDTGIATGGLGRTIASAIVNFNKAAVGPNVINMVAAKPGTNSVNFPVYTKIAVTVVTPVGTVNAALQIVPCAGLVPAVDVSPKASESNP